ncbi:Tex family protein [Aurantibacillus circumpalustris]|uniref:Tex family protein n=1 Tax=Aurantibacillus circumpalustris TaxID=3036359 RepID=UPI00295B08FB|nr:Tex family protein [Aurantibacillus circumpalustris]
MNEARLHFKIADLLNLNSKDVTATVNLLDEGGTVPFISRYRKEVTGSLDEVQIAQIRDEIERLRQLEQRRDSILKSIDSQNKLTEELKEKIMAAETLSKLEDLYLPYKPKRRTKATIAKEKGLEPLALFILEQKSNAVFEEAEKFISEEKEVPSVLEALQGARDIIAEVMSEDAIVRENLRELFKKSATIKSRLIKGKDEEGEKFEDYFEWEEKLMTCPSHRLLAMRRGEKEDILILDITVDNDEARELIERKMITSRGECATQMKEAIEEGYKRLLQPSIEAEMRLLTKQIADEKAIVVFADNLRELLLASPLGEKTILALDPGFRSGCKLVVLNKEGKLLEETVIYPHEPQKRVTEAEMILLAFCQRHDVEAIAIGNGTASRETEQFVRNTDVLPKSIPVIVVSEAGASVYSASDVAREEFPDKDVTVRGAVSIGRRLADPLAELVKVDPKSIGVGQYQHDVDQTHLKNKLDEVVSSCVNTVGVELNTASKQLLSYVSGIGPTLAQNIIEYRNEKGAFKSRKSLMEVPRMGEKVFEQCAGFLKIRNGIHPLDKSSVHPESYHIVEKMASNLNCSIDDLIDDKDLRKKIKLQDYVTETTGLPTLKDIMAELEKPGRDPRKGFEVFSFDENVHEIKDLREGMRLPGIVTNVTNFGAFVDIGVHQDGLVHISQLADEFVDDPNKIVKVGQQVWVNITEVDAKRKRIALTMKGEVQTVKQSKPKEVAKEEQYDPNDMNSALAALKSKFKK